MLCAPPPSLRGILAPCGWSLPNLGSLISLLVHSILVYLGLGSSVSPSIPQVHPRLIRFLDLVIPSSLLREFTFSSSSPSLGIEEALEGGCSYTWVSP